VTPFEQDDWTGELPAKKQSVLLSSERQDWRTPEWFVDMSRAVSRDGVIALDPATSPTNPTKARRFFAQDSGDCGLRADWVAFTYDGGLTFVNPPYGAHLSGPVEPDYVHTKKDKKTGERIVTGIGRGWAKKIAQHHSETIALVPVRTETEWWRTLFAWADLVLFWSSPEHGCRISFVNPDTGKPQQGSNLASTVFYRAPLLRASVGLERFRDAFGPHGTLVHGGSNPTFHTPDREAA